MNKKCVSIVKNKDILIYKYDLPIKDVKEFENSDLEYIESESKDTGNIYYDGNIYLQEWTKYKTKSLTGRFISDDFCKIGEYYSEDYGYLLFKNCVGQAKFKNCKLIIESPKISLDEFNNLLETINSYIFNLSFDFNQATFSNIGRDIKKRTDLDYHIYLLVYNAFTTKNNCCNILKNFKLIEQNPCRNFISEYTFENIENLSSYTDDIITDLFLGTEDMVPINSSNACKKLKNIKYLPRKVNCENIDYSFDNSENQFIKFFLNWCLEIIQKFQFQFLNQENFINYDLINNNEIIIKQLKLVLKQSFLNKVGSLSNIPTSSTVLTRRDGYRQIFNLFLGLKSIPVVDNFNDIKELIENKSIDVLYENYCYFTLADVLADIYKEKLNKKKYKVCKTNCSKTLSKKTSSNYFEFYQNEILPKIRIHYNKNYTIESYSKAYDPDISLEIFDKNDRITAIYIFDAKFKAIAENFYSSNENDSPEISYYKFEDINKMHTYRDAIKIAKGAFILYPGTENKIYYKDENIDKALLYGVGAFSLRPSNNQDKCRLSNIIKNLLLNYNDKIIY